MRVFAQGGITQDQGRSGYGKHDIVLFFKLSSPQIYHTQFYLVHYMVLCVMVFGKLMSTIKSELFKLNSLGFTSTKRKRGGGGVSYPEV